MPIPIRTETLVDADSTAASNTALSDAASHHVTRWWVTFDAAATVQVQGSHDGTTWIDLLAADVTVSGAIREISRPFKHLRAEWTGNTGDLTVIVERMYSNRDAAI